MAQGPVVPLKSLKTLEWYSCQKHKKSTKWLTLTSLSLVFVLHWLARQVQSCIRTMADKTCFLVADSDPAGNLCAMSHNADLDVANSWAFSSQRLNQILIGKQCKNLSQTGSHSPCNGANEGLAGKRGCSLSKRGREKKTWIKSDKRSLKTKRKKSPC